jgi:hypothetical protein
MRFCVSPEPSTKLCCSPNQSISKQKELENLSSGLTHIQENPNWVPSTDGVPIIMEITTKCIRITRLNDVYALLIQGFNRLIDWATLLVIISVAEPAM